MSNVDRRFEAILSIETKIMLLSINKLYAMIMRLMSISYRISCPDKIFTNKNPGRSTIEVHSCHVDGIDIHLSPPPSIAMQFLDISSCMKGPFSIFDSSNRPQHVSENSSVCVWNVLKFSEELSCCWSISI